MKIIFLLIFLCSGEYLIASDTTYFSCKYRYIKQKDSLKQNSKFDDVMILSIGKKESLYYSYLKQYGNKQMAEYISKVNSNNTNLTFNSSSDGSKYFIGNESEIIELDYTKKKISVTDQLVNSFYGYNDTLILPVWTIYADTLNILSQKCQRATTNFRGRNYIAWFTSSIPFRMGPWLLAGLPGLILKAEDDKNQFYFECIELNTSKTSTDIFREYKNIKMVSKKNLSIKKKLFTENIGAFMQAEDGVTFTLQNSNGISQRRPDKPYNPIDLTQ